jgi:hypothetical protein
VSGSTATAKRGLSSSGRPPVLVGAAAAAPEAPAVAATTGALAAAHSRLRRDTSFDPGEVDLGAVSTRTACGPRLTAG